MDKLIPLRGGGSIPRLGFGVWQVPTGKVAREAIAAALRAGYRHIDTARIYGNEADVGAAVRASGIPREEIFVTTKLWNDDHGRDAARRAFDRSLDRLGFDYVDLYLIHWPVGGDRVETWRALEEIHADGRARAIGVSNYMPNHLDELAAGARELPAVNQIEIHPFLQHRAARTWCKEHGVVVEAYSPLTSGERIADPRITAVAKRVGRTNAQVMLRWASQHDLVVLPKSVHEARIRENAAIFDFELDAEAMTALDALEDGYADPSWDPRTQP
jgi:diketogulonate reductase-like aldo/keto reductase